MNTLTGKPRRQDVIGTLRTLDWLSSGEQDEGMKADIEAVRLLILVLQEIGELA